MQAVLSALVTGYIELIIATLRWRTIGAGPADAALRTPEGIIALFWHGRIAHAMACRPVLGDKPRTVMISLSRDGAFIADAAIKLKIPTSGVPRAATAGRTRAAPPPFAQRSG